MAESLQDIFNEDFLSDFEQSPTLLADLVPNKQQKQKSHFELDQNEASGQDIISPRMIFGKSPNKFQPSVATVKNKLIENPDKKKSRSKISILTRNVTNLLSPKISCSLKDIETVTTPRKTSNCSKNIQDSQRIFNTKIDKLEEAVNDASKILKSLFQKLSSDTSSDLGAQYKMQLEMVGEMMENINECQIQEFYTKQLTMQTLFNTYNTLLNEINIKYPSLQDENSRTLSEFLNNDNNLSQGLESLTMESRSNTSSETFQEEDSETTASAPETHLIMSNLMPDNEENVSEMDCILETPITQPRIETPDSSEILEIDSIEYLKTLIIWPNDRREFIPHSEFEKKAPGFWDSDFKNDVPKWLLDEIDQW